MRQEERYGYAGREATVDTPRTNVRGFLGGLRALSRFNADAPEGVFLLLGVWLLLTGRTRLFGLDFPYETLIMAVLTLTAGVLLIVGS